DHRGDRVRRHEHLVGNCPLQTAGVGSREAGRDVAERAVDHENRIRFTPLDTGVGADPQDERRERKCEREREPTEQRTTKPPHLTTPCPFVRAPQYELSTSEG